jgi:hypothetical protein
MIKHFLKEEQDYGIQDEKTQGGTKTPSQAQQDQPKN